MLKHHGVWGVKPRIMAIEERGEGCEERAGEIPIYFINVFENISRNLHYARALSISKLDLIYSSIASVAPAARAIDSVFIKSPLP